MSSSSHIYISYLFVLVAEFTIYFVVIIYRTILTLLCSMILAAPRVFLTKCLLEIMSRNGNYNVASVLEMTATVEPRFNRTSI